MRQPWLRLDAAVICASGHAINRDALCLHCSLDTCVHAPALPQPQLGQPAAAVTLHCGQWWVCLAGMCHQGSVVRFYLGLPVQPFLDQRTPNAPSSTYFSPAPQSLCAGFLAAERARADGLLAAHPLTAPNYEPAPILYGGRLLPRDQVPGGWWGTVIFKSQPPGPGWRC